MRSGKETIMYLPEEKKVVVAENLCSGCGICVKKCLFNAISIVNLPEPLVGEETHRYGVNGFVLYSLPNIREGKVTGIIGANGTGKTTIVKILSGKLKPNLGDPNASPSWDDIITKFRGTELQNYLKKLANNKVKVVVKPERIEGIKLQIKATVKQVLHKIDERSIMDEIVEFMNLKHLLNRKISDLSGGELQTIAVVAACMRDADLYIFDEPTNFLDIFQRIKIAKLIRGLLENGKSVLVVEHDLAILDYLSDYIHVMYGVPGVYGVVSGPYGCREGINAFLEGYLPSENMRIRKGAIEFKRLSLSKKQEHSEEKIVEYSNLLKSFDNSFTLKVEAGTIYAGEIIGCVGPNGIGKTTFIKLLAGVLQCDQGAVYLKPEAIAYKPQHISPSFDGTVEELLKSIAGSKFNTDIYRTEIIQRLSLEKLLDREVKDLSSGELQRVAIASTLSRDADIYLLDEPSAHLDVEQRYAIVKAIRRLIEGTRKAAIIVEHDITTLEAISDRIIVFSGKPGIEGFAAQPASLKRGLNNLLKELDITLRVDRKTGRPRVNKPGSRLDSLARSTGQYLIYA